MLRDNLNSMQIYRQQWPKLASGNFKMRNEIMTEKKAERRKRKQREGCVC